MTKKLTVLFGSFVVGFVSLCLFVAYALFEDLKAFDNLDGFNIDFEE